MANGGNKTMNKLERIYMVEFMKYSNYARDTVSTYDDSYSYDTSKIEYLKVGKEPFLIRESEIEKYRKFGNGYRNLEFIGCMEINESE